MHVHIEQVY